MISGMDMIGAGPGAHRYAMDTQARLATSIERLSTGLRINSAADDAAGLANSAHLATRVTGTRVAIRNVQDAVSVTRIADGALGETHALLQQMRDLTVRRGNADVLGADGVAKIDIELRATLDTLDRIAASARFNGKNLLDGTFSGVFHVGAEPDEFMVMSIDRDMSVTGLGLSALRTAVGGDNPGSAATGIAGLADAGTAPLQLLDAGAQARAATTTAAMDEESWAQLADGTAHSFKLTGPDGSTTQVNLRGDATADPATFVRRMDNQTQDVGVRTTQSPDGVLFTAKEPGAGTITVSAATRGGAMVPFTGYVAEAGADAVAALYAPTGDDAIGRLDDADLITTLDRAIELVSTQRAAVGAVENALVRRGNQLTVQGENLSAALSRMRDADLAAEITALRMNQILLGGAAQVLERAQLVPENYMALLRDDTEEDAWPSNE